MTDPATKKLLEETQKLIDAGNKELEEIKKLSKENQRVINDNEATIKIYGTEDPVARKILEDLDNREKKGRTP